MLPSFSFPSSFSDFASSSAAAMRLLIIDFIGIADCGTEKLSPLYDASTLPSVNERVTPLMVFGDANSTSHIPVPYLLTVPSEFISSRVIATLALNELLSPFGLSILFFPGAEHDVIITILSNAAVDLKSFFIKPLRFIMDIYNIICIIRQTL